MKLVLYYTFAVFKNTETEFALNFLDFWKAIFCIITILTYRFILLYYLCALCVNILSLSSKLNLIRTVVSRNEFIFRPQSDKYQRSICAQKSIGMSYEEY